MKYYSLSLLILILISCSGKGDDDIPETVSETSTTELSPNDYNETQNTNSQNNDSNPMILRIANHKITNSIVINQKMNQ